MSELASEPAADVDAPAAPRRRRRRWRGVLALLVVVAVAGFVLAGRLGGIAPVQSALLGHPAPPLSGTTLDGSRFDISEWRGQVVLVNIWASWCYPCRREQPLLASADAALAPRGLHTVGINVRDSAGNASAFLAEFGGGTWPSVRDPNGQRAVEWGAFALPETYLVGRDGTVVAKATGEVDASWIDDNVVPLLRAGSP